jgi:hypothetical protein
MAFWIVGFEIINTYSSHLAIDVGLLNILHLAIDHKLIAGGLVDREEVLIPS